MAVFPPCGFAIEDFVKAIWLHPSDGFAVIWLHLARVRAGQDDRQELTRNAADVDHAQWPGPVVELFLGLINSQTILTNAPSEMDVFASRRRSCQIEFYLGVFELERSAKDEERQLLKAAIKDCVAIDIEMAAAQAELAAVDVRQ